METVAEIVADAMLAMNVPAEFFHPRDAVRIIRRRMAFYSVKQGQGDTRTPLASKELNYTGDNLLLPDVVSPDWVERRLTDAFYVNDSDGWVYVPTINIDTLPEWRAEGRSAVAFYFDPNGSLRMQFSEIWAGDNNATYRIWHHPQADIVSNLTDTVNLPPNFAFMLAAEVRFEGFNTVLNKAAQITDDNPPSTLQIAAWKAMQDAAGRELAEWRQAFEEARNRSFGGRRGRQRRPVLRGQQWKWGIS